ncbi:MAG: outer membrane lipid asymmetry maintenance protein MlaD [Burkholderiaceae bacterium]|jgi:phospholipid/cholesterol/gamma-HCH transport system substrate-binding protein
MQKKSIDLWVGLFIITGLLAALFLALKAANLGSLNTGKTYTVRARFDNIGGLKARAPVKSAGVIIGRVSDIRLDPQRYQAVVTISLAEGFRFPKDTSAKILTSGLLGEQYVGFTAGFEDANLIDGDQIKSTQSAVVLEDLIGQFLYSKAADTPAEKK